MDVVGRVLKACIFANKGIRRLQNDNILSAIAWALGGPAESPKHDDVDSITGLGDGFPIWGTSTTVHYARTASFSLYPNARNFYLSYLIKTRHIQIKLRLRTRG